MSGLVGRRPFDAVDDHNINGPPLRLQSQAELFLQRSHQWNAIRRRCARRGPSPCEIEVEVKGPLDTGSVDYEATGFR